MKDGDVVKYQKIHEGCKQEFLSMQKVEYFGKVASNSMDLYSVSQIMSYNPDVKFRITKNGNSFTAKSKNVTIYFTKTNVMYR